MFKKINKLLFLCFLLLIFFNGKSMANIVLDKMVLDFLPKDPPQKNIIVFNSGDEVSYVSTEIFEIKNPGLSNEKRVAVVKKEKNRLIIAPSKIALEEQSKKGMQFISNEEDSLKTDRVYRVSVVPNVGEIRKDTNGIGIKILVGYDVLVIIRPKVLNFDLKVEKIVTL